MVPPLMRGYRMSILLVEDDEFARELLEIVLTGAGLDVVAVADGDEALELIEQGETFDLLVTDIRLPGRYDGWSTAVEVRRFMPDIPVIYMTASHQQSCAVSRSVYLRTDVTVAVPVLTSAILSDPVLRREPKRLYKALPQAMTDLDAAWIKKPIKV